ncbi:MAG: histidinol-phosphate transaminase [Anaerolineae bacterium]|nr:histidinol-phosphate transaminase [Anaerolineae bacterium]
MTSARFARLLRPHIAELEPYTPIVPFEVLSRQLGRPPEQIVKLDANENPYGPHPAVRQALERYPFLHIYPDPEQRELRAALAAYVGVPADHILASSGADELIDLICRLTLGPGDAVLDCPPTFGMYSFDAALAGAHVHQVWRRADFSVDVEQIGEWMNGRIGEPANDVSRLTPDVSRATPKLLFLTSPNNPDGSLLDPAALRQLLELPLLVIVDEAYIEFAGLEHSVARWVPECDNLIVLRTFSKWAGIAGLRLGYGIFPAWLMPTLWKTKQPYNVNVAATVAGLAALAHRAEIHSTVEALIAERERLYRELAAVPFLHPYPSRANFILCRVEGRDARELKATLAARGILVRHYAKPGLENCIRISAGRPDQTDALLRALREV